MAGHLLQRIKNPTGRNACYKGVKCLIGTTVTEVRAYLLAHFENDIERLVAEGELPSVDRINSKGHYEEGNIRVISKRENELRGLANAVLITSKPVTVTYPNGEIKQFASVSEASRATGLKRDTIALHRANGTTSKKGYTFV